MTDTNGATFTAYFGQFKLPTQGTRWTQRLAEESLQFIHNMPSAINTALLGITFVPALKSSRFSDTPRTSASSASSALRG